VGVQVDEVLHTCYGLSGGHILKAAASAVDEASPRLLAAGTASHTEAVYLGSAVAVIVKGTLLNRLQEFLISGGHFNASLLEIGSAGVIVQHLDVPGHYIQSVLAAASSLRNVVVVLIDVILVLPSINNGSKVG